MGWYQVVSWRHEVVDTHNMYNLQGPLSCPRDGEPLQTGGGPHVDGTTGHHLRCKYCGFTANGDPRHDMPHD